MLRGGEDLAFIGRRLVRCASEDIGIVDNSSLDLAVTVMQWWSDIFKRRNMFLKLVNNFHRLYNDELMT